MSGAIGFLEVNGYSVALAAMDSACKAANVKIEGMDCNNPILGDKADIPVVVQVKFTGKIGDVQVALDAARNTALKYNSENDILTHCVITSNSEINKLLPTGKVKLK